MNKFPPSKSIIFCENLLDIPGVFDKYLKQDLDSERIANEIKVKR